MFCLIILYYAPAPFYHINIEYKTNSFSRAKHKTRPNLQTNTITIKSRVLFKCKNREEDMEMQDFYLNENQVIFKDNYVSKTGHKNSE